MSWLYLASRSDRASDPDSARLILYAEMKLPGEAWLDFEITPTELRQTATFRPRFASRAAVIKPPSPAPITATSTRSGTGALTRAWVFAVGTCTGADIGGS